MFSAASKEPSLREASLASKRRDYALWLVLLALTLVYAVAIFYCNRRYVWFDELFTLNIARASTYSRLWKMILLFDANPPTSYLLSRISMAILGPGRWGLRLPSIVEFYLGSLAIFFYVRRKVGTAFAAFAVLLLWVSGAFYYADEARPYALLFTCCAFLLLAWDTATRSDRRRLALWAVALANLGMFLAHAFAPFSLLPFFAAEAARYWRRRKTDWAMWAALTLPMAAMVLYIPLSSSYKFILFPPAFLASLPRLKDYFYDTVTPIAFTLLIALVAVLLIAPMRGDRREASGIRAEDHALFWGFLASPLLLTLALMHRHGAFWDRYCLTTYAAIYVALAILLGLRAGTGRRAALAAYAASLIFAHAIFHVDVQARIQFPTPANERALTNVMPNLPIVDASMLTFFEMNQYEDSALLSRLYYLKDRNAAVRYAHATLFEDFLPPDRLESYFPISANVEQYNAFLRQHDRFLVFGSSSYPEDWLIPKLLADGAQMKELGTYPGPYKDSTLYLVSVATAERASGAGER